MKRALWFCVASGVVIALAAWIGAAAFHSRIGDDGVDAIVMSAGIAFVVQCLTFGVALVLMPSSRMLGFAAGMVMRLFTVLIHGLVGVRLLGVPAGPALLSLLAFVLVTLVLEVVFMLRTPAANPESKPTALPS